LASCKLCSSSRLKLACSKCSNLLQKFIDQKWLNQLITVS
jgi:hypothetical protein